MIVELTHIFRKFRDLFSSRQFNFLPIPTITMQIQNLEAS